MCGIAGVLVLSPEGPGGLDAGRPAGTAALRDELEARLRAQLEVMISALRHRGPDETGFLLDREVGLASARLAILDLAGGGQPIASEDGSVSVVANCEVFNFVELRSELEARGHRFRTTTDTEVMVHLYEESGPRFVDRLVGDFAVALWDARRRRLVLARDRVGVRPLFWTRAGGRLLFASEVKSLFALPDVPRRLDLRALAETFTFWAPLAPRTPFEGVLALEPGHVMTVEDGRIEVQRYWDWVFPAEADLAGARPDGEVLEEARAVIDDAVRIRLRSDVPVGAYLSGGLDSSIVTALARRRTSKPLRTFSLRFEDAGFDEGAHQEALVSHLEVEHTSILCREQDIAAVFPRTILHTEAPVVRTAAAPLLLLSSLVREAGFKVVLTGEGADEVFGGYDLFKEARIRRFAARHPGSGLPERIRRRLYPWLRHSPVATGAFADRFLGAAGGDPEAPLFGHETRMQATRRALRFLSAGAAGELDGFDPAAELRARLPLSLARSAPLCRDQYVEANTLLSGYLLSSQGDRVSMASSVEGRVPFLDHRVIAFANRLPPRWKLFGTDEKHVLKRSLGHLLPRQVAERTKQPYRAPDARSFFQDGRAVPWVADLLSPRRLLDAGLFDPHATARLVEKCRTGGAVGFADNMAFVGILSTMLVDELFVHARPLP